MIKDPDEIESVCPRCKGRGKITESRSELILAKYVGPVFIIYLVYFEGQRVWSHHFDFQQLVITIIALYLAIRGTREAFQKTRAR